MLMPLCRLPRPRSVLRLPAWWPAPDGDLPCRRQRLRRRRPVPRPGSLPCRQASILTISLWAGTPSQSSNWFIEHFESEQTSLHAVCAMITVKSLQKISQLITNLFATFRLLNLSYWMTLTWPSHILLFIGNLNWTTDAILSPQFGALKYKETSKDRKTDWTGVTMTGQFQVIFSMTRTGTALSCRVDDTLSSHLPNCD